MRPTARTLRLLAAQGYYADVVERWVACGADGSGVRKDFCGFADIIAFHPVARKIVAVQATGAAVANRLAKVRASRAASDWMRAGGELWVIGWRKLRGRWQPRIEVERLGGSGA